MSKPVLSGERLQVDTTGGVLRVTNDPGFTSDNGDGCPYRAVLLRGPLLYGRDVPQTTRPDEHWPGRFTSREAFAAWRLPVPAGTYTLIVWGGSYFTGWGDHPEDAIEWGNNDGGNNPDGVPRVNAVTFTVAGQTPPPPTGDRRLELDPRLPVIRDNTLAEFAAARAPFLAWAGANPNEYAKVQAYLAAVADGESPAPPSLKSHKGRGLVGLLQAGAATIGRLPQ